MKATNSLVPEKEEKKPFSAVITGKGAQKLIRASLKDEAAVRRFTGTLISVVNGSEQLRNCDAGTIISCALRGEGAGLNYGHGYYVVPYGSTATYILSYKGIIQLALATGLYADIDCIDVREGEHRGRDKRTGKPIIDMSVYETDEEREQHPIIGYKAYFELKDGFYKEEYWTLDQLLKHADRYSKAFSSELYHRWQSGGELTQHEVRTVESGSPWFTSTDRMMRKTVLKSLLNSGYAPLSNEVKSALNQEPESGEGVIPDIGDLGVDVVPEYTVVESTGEVIDAPQDAPEPPESDSEPQATNDTPKAEKPQRAEKRGRRAQNPKPVDVEMGADDMDAIESFFGDDE